MIGLVNSPTSMRFPGNLTYPRFCVTLMKSMNILFVMCLAAMSAMACGGNPTAPSPAVHVPSSTGTPAPTIPTVPTTILPVGSWSETFSGPLSSRWQISDYAAGVGGNVFSPARVDTSQGALGLCLIQDRNGGNFGAEVQSTDRYSFGVYTWVMRASSTSSTPTGAGTEPSGETSGVFLYAPGSETELDFEQEGSNAFKEFMHFVTYKNGRVVDHDWVQVGPTIYQTFHTYQLTWLPTSVTYAIDGQVRKTWSKDIPQTPAFIFMNHWGTENPTWGGEPTPGIRWMWVQSFSFEPR